MLSKVILYHIVVSIKDFMELVGAIFASDRISIFKGCFILLFGQLVASVGRLLSKIKFFP